MTDMIPYNDPSIRGRTLQNISEKSLSQFSFMSMSLWEHYVKVTKIAIGCHVICQDPLRVSNDK